ncbi:MAG TPA: hypothetical protein VKV40_10840 [Ktedonobacteraceae bacterium]|nr:hypothetical protein [Ktedonobacteraceae bacterium]
MCQTPIHSRHVHPTSDGPTITGRLRCYCSDKCRKAASRQRRSKPVQLRIALTQEEQQRLHRIAQASGADAQTVAAFAVRALLAGHLRFEEGNR